jgi:hypothetical protein
VDFAARVREERRGGASSILAENYCAAGAKPSAGSAYTGEFGVWRLSRPSFTAQLPHGFNNEEEATHSWMAGGETSTVSISGQGPANAQLPVGDEWAAFAFRAKAEIFECHEQHVGEGVVQCADIDFGRLHTRAFECQRSGHRSG